MPEVIKVPTKRFINRTQIASFIGVSRMTLYRWEKKHPLPKQGILNHHYIRAMSNENIIKWLRQLYANLHYRARRELKYSLSEEIVNQVCSR